MNQHLITHSDAIFINFMYSPNRISFTTFLEVPNQKVDIDQKNTKKCLENLIRSGGDSQGGCSNST